MSKKRRAAHGHGGHGYGCADGSEKSIAELLGWSGDDEDNVQFAPWPWYEATPELGSRSARGYMEPGEQHSGLQDDIPYVIRRMK